MDQRGSDFDIFAQRINTNGGRIFPVAGSPVCQAVDDQDEPELIFDGSFVIVTWEDLRSLQANNFDIFANQVPPGIALGVVAPEPAPASDLRVRLLSSNPWSAEARLTVDLPERARVEANVYGTQGRWLRSLEGAELTAGTHILRWDGRNAAGVLEPAGVYFLRVQAGHRSSVVEARAHALIPSARPLLREFTRLVTPGGRRRPGRSGWGEPGVPDGAGAKWAFHGAGFGPPMAFPCLSGKVHAG